MPIKIPKTFARRKSSGNVLDEVEAPASAPSFRVLERRPQTSKSFDGGSKLVSVGAAVAAPVPLTATGTAARSSFVAPADRLRDGSRRSSDIALNRCVVPAQERPMRGVFADGRQRQRWLKHELDVDEGVA